MTEVLKLVYEALRLRKLIRRIVQDSIPSVAAYGALTIAPKTWVEMFEMVAPELALYTASLRSADENLLPADLEVAKRLTRKPLSEDELLAQAEKEIEAAEATQKQLKKALAVLKRLEAVARKRGWSEKWGCPFWEFLEDLYGNDG